MTSNNVILTLISLFFMLFFGFWFGFQMGIIQSYEHGVSGACYNQKFTLIDCDILATMLKEKEAE